MKVAYLTNIDEQENNKRAFKLKQELRYIKKFCNDTDKYNILNSFNYLLKTLEDYTDFNKTKEDFSYDEVYNNARYNFIGRFVDIGENEIKFSVCNDFSVIMERYAIGKDYGMCNLIKKLFEVYGLRFYSESHYYGKYNVTYLDESTTFSNKYSLKENLVYAINYYKKEFSR